MKRIGAILVANGLIEQGILDRALLKQKETGQRLCSLLIEIGLLTFDQASRALGEQLGVGAVLQKHIDHRVQSLAKILPAAVARKHGVLPIGRTGGGDLICCARDPKPELRGAISRIVSESVVLAVAPAVPLARLILETYGEDAAPSEIEVDLNTGPVPSLDDDVESLDEELPDLTEEMQEGGESMTGLASMTLVELDDRGVTKDYTQSGQIQVGPMVRETLPPPTTASRTVTSTLPPSTGRTVTTTLPPKTTGVASLGPALPPRGAPVAKTPTLPPKNEPVAAATVPPPPSDAIAAGTQPPSRDGALTDVIAAMRKAATPGAVADAAIAHAASRWTSALMLAVRDGSAMGYRGHGRQLAPEVVHGVALPLTAASIVKAAYETGKLVTSVPPDTGVIQDRLERLLGMPRFPAAVPINVNDQIAFILVIGDPIAGDPDAAALELERLAKAMSATFARFV